MESKNSLESLLTNRKCLDDAIGKENFGVSWRCGNNITTLFYLKERSPDLCIDLRHCAFITSKLKPQSLFSKLLCDSKREAPRRGNNTPLTIFSYL